MSQTIKVTVHTASEQTNQTVNVVQGSGKTGQPTHIRAIKDARYQLQDVNNNNVAPEKINAKRVGKNLHLSLDAGNEADLVIDGYYDVHTTTDSGSIFSQMQDGSIHEYIASSTANNGAIASLTDGGVYTQQVLSTEAVAGFELSGLPAAASALPGYIGAGAVGTVAVAEVTKKEEDPIELTTLRNAAQNNSATATTITTQTYAAAGITGVTDANVAAINSALNSAAITGTEAGGRAQLQAIVDSYIIILAEAKDARATDPTAANYAAIGVTGVKDGGQTQLLNDAIHSKTTGQVSSVPDLQRIADAAAAVTNGTASKADLEALGLQNVTDSNLAAVQKAIADAKGAGKPISSMADLAKTVLSANEAAATVAATELSNADQAMANANTALAGAKQNLSSPATPEQIVAVETAQKAATDAAAALSAASQKASAAVTAATQAAAAANTPVAASVNKLATDVTAANTAVTAAQTAAAASETATDAAIASLVTAATNAATALTTATTAMADAKATLATAKAALGSPATEAQIKAVQDAQDALNTATDAASSAATAATAAADLAKAAAQAGGETVPTSVTDIAAQVSAANTAVTAAQTAATASEAATDAAIASLVTAATNAATALTTATTAMADAKATLATAKAALDSPATAAQIKAVQDAQDALNTATDAASSAATAATAAADLAKAAAQAGGETVPTSVTDIAAQVSAANTAVTAAQTAATASEAATDAAIASLVTAATNAATALTTATTAMADAKATLATAKAALGNPATAAQIKDVQDAQDALSTATTAASDAATAATTAANLAKAAAQAGGETVPTSVTDIAAQVTAANTAVTAAQTAATASETATDAAIADLVTVATTKSSDLATAQTNFNTAKAALASALGAMSNPATAVELTAVANAQSALNTAATALSTAATAAADAVALVASAETAGKETATDKSAITTAVTAANTAVTDAAKAVALATIQAAAQGNTATATSPSLADYAAAGVTGVTAENLAAINTSLNTNGVNGAAADTQAHVQSVVSAFSAILANAGDTANTAANVTNPTKEQYAAIGVTGVSSTAEVGLLGDVIDGKAATDVNTTAKVQALADAVKAVQNGTASLEQLAALGVTGANAQNIASIHAALASGASSLSALQTIVDGANDAPVLATMLADQSATASTAFSYTVPANSFTDADNATLSYTATLADGTALPTWLSFNASTQTFSGTAPANTNGTVTTVSVKVTASDGSLSASDIFNIAIDPGAPKITSVSITNGSVGWKNNFVNTGDTVTATVSFDEKVTVTGTPTLKLNIGGTLVDATYSSGSGSTALSFKYTITSGETDTNGISIDANQLSLNGGSIKNAAVEAADLTYTDVADNSTYKVDTTVSAPTINASSTDNILRGTEQVVLSGTTEAYASVAVTLPNNTLTTVAANSSGVWSLTSSNTPATIRYVMVRRQNDGSGDAYDYKAIFALGDITVMSNGTNVASGKDGTRSWTTGTTSNLTDGSSTTVEESSANGDVWV